MRDCIMICALAAVFSSFILLAAEEKKESMNDGMRDPMSRVKKVTTKETDTQQSVSNKDHIQEIQLALNRCRIEGLAISGDVRCVVINDSILSEGDRILPDSDIRIAKIEEGKVVFVLDSSEVEYIMTPVEEDVIPM
jgi:hypothetical protein